MFFSLLLFKEFSGFDPFCRVCRTLPWSLEHLRTIFGHFGTRKVVSDLVSALEGH